MQDEKVLKTIRALVYLHSVHVKSVTGLDVNVLSLQEYLYAEYLAGYVTFEEINEDIQEYLEMRKEKV